MARLGIPTAPVAAGSLIVGYGVAVASGSRPLGGVVLLCGGAWCVREWLRRHGAAHRACADGAFGLGAFVLSHVLALAVGAWPAVLARLRAAMARSRLDSMPTRGPAHAAARRWRSARPRVRFRPWRRRL